MPRNRLFEQGSCKSPTILRAELLERGSIPDADAPIPASNLAHTPVQWLFPGWIPAGKISLLLGPLGIGKSLVTLDLAARISRGMPMPLCSFQMDPADVMIFAGQDGATDTIGPRLEAAGADLSRIHLFPGGGQDKLKDARLLELLIDRYCPALVIVDPVQMASGLQRAGSRISAGTPVARIARIAEYTGAAILMVHSSAESAASGPVAASAGGAQYAAAARSVMLISRDSIPDKRLLVHLKGNLAPSPMALRFRIRAEDEYSQPGVYWTDVAQYVSADMVAENQPAAAAALRSAENFLRKALEPGRIDSRKLQEMAREQGIAPRTLTRARQQLTRAVRVDGLGLNGKWMVELEPTETAHAD